jgi:tagaturonate reductase
MLLSKENYGGYKKYPEKVLQFGTGNFLRGFADWIIDKMNDEINFNGSIVVVQSQPSKNTNSINLQDGLFTLYLKEERDGMEYTEHKVINCISRVISTSSEYGEYLRIAENPEMRFIISNTTEAGIFFSAEDRLDSAPQQSFPGKLTAFMYERFKYFNGALDKGVIIIPCELIDRNGDKLKETVLKYAELWRLEKGFVNWINEANTFCCSLVDRVVSGFPKNRIEEYFSELGYEDNFIVEAEFYHQWIIEGPEWIKKELPFELVGDLNVKVVDNVDNYRNIKVRMLNGIHTAMMPVGYLYGMNSVRDCMQNKVISQYINEVMFEEIVPTLNFDKDNLYSFAQSLFKRFGNPTIEHQLMSISLNSMSKFEARVLPSIIEYHERYGRLPKKLIFSLAALIKFYSGVRDGEEIKLSDTSEVLNLYKISWESYERKEIDLRQVVINILSYDKVWKSNLNNIMGLTDIVSLYLQHIEAFGIAEAIKLVM